MIIKLFILITIIAVAAICILSIAVSTSKGTEMLQDSWDKAAGSRDKSSPPG